MSVMAICNASQMFMLFCFLIFVLDQSFSSGFERKLVSTVLINFRDKGKHLGALFNKMGSRKLGNLRVFPAVGDCGKTHKE